ncbi:MAG: hypothetical protein K2X78_10575, partial [Burkholderiaceae bacterium]|nr:hypothetical protein [Burkholderiaceae bacterium]
MDILAAASIAQPPPSMLQMLSLPLNCSGQVTSEQICQLGSPARTAQAEQPNKSFVKRCCACVCALTHVLRAANKSLSSSNARCAFDAAWEKT